MVTHWTSACGSSSPAGQATNEAPVQTGWDFEHLPNGTGASCVAGPAAVRRLVTHPEAVAFLPPAAEGV